MLKISFYGFIFKLVDVLFWDVKTLELVDLFLFYFLDQHLLGLPVFHELFVVDLLELLGLLLVLVMGDDLLFEFVCVLLQAFFSFLLEFLLDLLELLLLPDCCFELCLFSLCLLLQSPLLLDLLFYSGLL